jgi:hypothetical protein
LPQREQRGLPQIGTLFADLKYAARMLRTNPGFTLIAVPNLMLGIGVVTTVFTAYNAVALKPLPVADPSRVVRLRRRLESGSRDEDGTSRKNGNRPSQMGLLATFSVFDSSYRRPAALCWAFFWRRGRRDLFFGGSFPFFRDFVEGFAPASEAPLLRTGATGSFLFAISFCFANRMSPPLNCTLIARRSRASVRCSKIGKWPSLAF